MDDKQIIALYNNRDERAIEESERKYGSYCYVIAENILHSALDSEECVSDTWMCSWDSIPPASPHDLRMYFARIVRNLSINRYKHARREKRGGGGVNTPLDELREVSTDIGEPHREAETRELVARIEAFLHSLPERECNIFLQRYFYFDDISVIASRYRLRESNLLVILSRTRKKLKQYLKEEGYDV